MPNLTKRQKQSSRNQERKSRFSDIRSLKRLREERLDAYRAMERLRRSMGKNENGRFSGEQRQQWERAVRDFNDASRQIQVETKLRSARREIETVEEDRLTRDHNGFRLNRQDNRGERPKITNELRNKAMQAWFMTRSGREDKLTREHRQACKIVGLNRRSDELEVKLYNNVELRHLQERYRRFHPAIASEHMRAFSINNPADGSVLTYSMLVQNLEVALMDYSGIMQVADVITTDHGNDLSWPTANDTANKGRRIGAGKSKASATTSIFKSQVWKAWKYTSDELSMEHEMIEDAGFDLTGYIPTIAGERIGRIFNDEATTGTGGTMPDGIESATVGKTTASSTVITGDEIIQFIGSVDPAYRQGAQFMMNDAIMTEVALLKDGQNNYLWRAGLELGQPDRIRGYGVVPNASMDSTLVASNIVMAFGKLNMIKVRRVRGIRFYRERDNTTDTEKFYAYVRMDSKILNAGTNPIKTLKMKP